jgi:hypothetical protein
LRSSNMVRLWTLRTPLALLSSDVTHPIISKHRVQGVVPSAGHLLKAPYIASHAETSPIYWARLRNPIILKDLESVLIFNWAAERDLTVGSYATSTSTVRNSYRPEWWPR